MARFYPLTVADVQRETRDAVVVTFEVPAEHKDDFQFKQGQYLTFRKMIDGEDASRPLSDSRIAELLGAGGLPLARRTVAKYREELRIPPSNLRKSVH